MADIVEIPWYEAVRHRPSMFVGGTDDRGLFFLFREAFDFSAQEFRCGLLTRIAVTFHVDHSISIEDDGAGPDMSPPLPPDSGTALERLTSDLYWLQGRTGKFRGAIAPSLAVINALSSRMEVESRRNGQCGLIRYERGACVEPLRLSATTADDGYRLRFRFDEQIFPSARYASAALRHWLWEQSALHPGLRIVFHDEPSGTTERLREPDGMAALLREECLGTPPIWPEPLRIEMRQGPFRYDLAVHCLQRDGLSLCSFANGSPTPEGGAHVIATRDALAVALRRFVKGNGMEKVGWPWEKLLRGIVAAIAVDLPDPEFVGPTREKLANHEVEQSIHEFVSDSVTMLLKRKPDLVKPWRDWLTSRTE